MEQTVRLTPLNESEIGQSVQLFGRILQVRDMRNVIFFDIVNAQCKIQCMFLKKDKSIKLSKGDLIECDGIVAKSNTGHICLQAENVDIVRKSQLLIPDTWTGSDLAMKDAKTNESLYLLVNGEKVTKVYKTLMELQNNMRNYLVEKSFEEVKTPILQMIASGAIARPFKTHHNFLNKEIEIRIAPELMLKRLLIAGYPQIFEIGQCFRNEGSSYAHLQEFTMLEAYRIITSDYEKEYKKWQSFCKNILGYLIENATDSCIDAQKVYNMPSITYSDLLLQYIGYDLKTLWNDDKLLRELCIKYNIDMIEYPTKDDRIERLYKLYARSQLKDPVMVTCYPTMPLAKSQPGDMLSYQFQVVIDTHEVLKACIEEDDPAEQDRKFKEQDSKAGAVNGEIAQSDDSFIECMKLGFPPAVGVGIGLNRLTQIICGADHIRNTVMFSV